MGIIAEGNVFMKNSSAMILLKFLELMMGFGLVSRGSDGFFFLGEISFTFGLDLF